jgi:3-carboxy-cis,cis-muconate cycloisomerase
MTHEHERAAGAWQAEWAALPQLFRHTAYAVERIHVAVAGLVVYPERMRANLELTAGLLMAESLSMTLAPHIGRQEAYRIVQAACERAREQQTTLQNVASADEAITSMLTESEIARALDPANYLGSTDAFINRALAGYLELRAPVETAW